MHTVVQIGHKCLKSSLSWHKKLYYEIECESKGAEVIVLWDLTQMYRICCLFGISHLRDGHLLGELYPASEGPSMCVASGVWVTLDRH